MVRVPLHHIGMSKAGCAGCEEGIEISRIGSQPKNLDRRDKDYTQS